MLAPRFSQAVMAGTAVSGEQRGVVYARLAGGDGGAGGGA